MILMNWTRIRCLVTGGAGFIGSHLLNKLVEKKAEVRVVDDLSRGKMDNLKKCLNQVEFIHEDLEDASVALKCVEDVDFCFHLAAVVGGIEFMKSYPAKMCKNIRINYNIIEACRRSDVERMLYVSSACVYPIALQKDASKAPLKEEDALKYGADPDGYYGWSKLLGEIQCRAYHEEYGMNIAVVRPFNPYGPNESFDPKDSHVIPALIRKAAHKETPFVIWGSGKQERAFTYVSDLVEGMLLAIEKSVSASPINLGTDEVISIKDLAELILKLTDHDVPINYDRPKPVGVISRKADISEAKRILGWRQKIDLETGLKKTINWYLKQQSVRRSKKKRR